MNLRELTTKIKEETGYSKKEIKEIIDAATTCIGNSLIDGEEVHIYKFGSFEIRHVGARNVCSIKTGKIINARDYNKIVFVPTGELKQAINMD